MELFLLEIFALFRPITLMEIGEAAQAQLIFSLAGIALIGILILSMFIRMGLGRKIQLTAIDQLIILYVLWCIAISIIYPDKTQLAELVKWTSTFLTYTVTKHALNTHKDYARIILLLLIGLSVPILISSIMIYLDIPTAFTKEYYTTKLKLYEGAYANPVVMGFSAFLFVVFGFLYYRIVKTHPTENEYRLSKIRIIAFLILIPSAVYCLVQSASRTAMLGLVIFLSLYLFNVAKKYLFILVFALVGVLILFAAPLNILFYDVVTVVEGERPVERIASGRPYMWGHNLSEYSKMSLDRQFAGAGIGNTVKVRTYSLTGESFWPSHNDFLHVFIHTGFVGFCIVVLLHFAILKKVLAIEGNERTFFLAFFFTATAMNFASNSFLTNFGLAQIYFVVMAYIEAMPQLVRRQNGINGVTTKVPALNRTVL